MDHACHAPLTNASADAPLRVFLVDDHLPVRGRLADLLRCVSGLSIVGEAGSAADATAGILATAPDAVVLDFQLGGGTGLEVLRAVHPDRPDIVFIVLTNHASAQYRRLSLASGARHFLDKSNDFPQVAGILSDLHAARHSH